MKQYIVSFEYKNAPEIRQTVFVDYTVADHPNEDVFNDCIVDDAVMLYSEATGKNPQIDAIRVNVFENDMSFNIMELTDDQLWNVLRTIRELRNIEMTYWTIADLHDVMERVDGKVDHEYADTLWNDYWFRRAFRDSFANTTSLQELYEEKSLDKEDK